MKHSSFCTVAACTIGILMIMLGTGCDGQGAPGNVTPKGSDPKATPPTTKDDKPALEKVTIAGRTFMLELALEDQTRFRGMSGRTEIAADGGMLFVFKDPKVQEFVMRDCPIAIDIIYLDGSGRVTAAYKMAPEPPRSAEEAVLTVPFPGAPQWSGTNLAYEKRLKKYSSRFASQYVIELKGNTLDELKLKEGDKIELDRAKLKKLAK